MTRFSQYCNILLNNMKINKKKLFRALFDWTNNDESYFSGTVPYPFMDGSRPLPDVFQDAFSLTPHAYSSAKKCISLLFLTHIIDNNKLRNELIAFIENEFNLSSSVRKYLLDDCKDDDATFYTCILYIILTGSQHLPTLSFKDELMSSLITNIPAPSAFFLGREDEIQAIKSTLSSYGICYVWGISGIGKSDLVCKYARTEKSNYANIIYMKYHQSIETSVAMLANMNNSDSFTLSERFNINSKILNNLGKNTLVILDNFDICAENDPYFSWLIGCDFDLIITSRMQPIDIPDVHVGELTLIQSHHLFKAHCKNMSCSISDETIHMICDKLMYHTLVIILVAKAITYTELTVDEIIAALDKSLSTLPTQTRITISKDSTIRTELYSNFIAELFNFANLNRPEKMLLCMMAIMPLDGISKTQFLSYTGEKTLDVINKYVRLGYIEYRNNMTISMHPLIADTCIRTLTDIPRHAIKEVLSNFFFAVYAHKTYPSIEEQLIAVSICEVILQHPEYELTHEMIDLTSFFTKCGQYLHTVDTTDYVLSHQNNLGEVEKDYSTALSTYYKGLALLQIGNKEEAKRCLATTITTLGNKEDFSMFEAELFFNAIIEHAACENTPKLCIQKLQDIKIREDCLPNDNYKMLLSRISFKIATNYLLLNEYKKAQELFNESLLIRNEVLGPNSVSSGLALGNIAYSFQKMGKYELAAEYYEMGIHILSKHYPDNHMNLIRMHLNCATAYYCIKPTGIMENKAEYHFSVAASSAEKVVVENRTKKKKGFLQSILNIQPRSMINYDYPVHIISQQVDFHIMPNSGPIPGIDERIHSYFESFQPRENVSAYLSDDMIRILEEIKLDIH